MNKPETEKSSSDSNMRLKYSQEEFFKKLLKIAADHSQELTTSLGITEELKKERI